MQRAVGLRAPCGPRSRLCSLRDITEWEGAALLRDGGLQRGNNITRPGVVCDLLLGSALPLFVGDHLHRISIHDERSKCLKKFKPNRYQ